MNYLYFSSSGDGQKNLAKDEWFLDHVGKDDLILYFYVNKNAVIIGKNQNPWRECDFERMKEKGVQLVRRISGGGAVYHDKGNLNFSFNAGLSRFDKEKQHCFILETVRSLGIPCEFSGRNDLLAYGKKFSGNAYCMRAHACQHHGTLLVSTDLSFLSSVLKPDLKKLSARGVSSVRTRVCNLNEFLPGLCVNDLKKVIPEAFKKVYGDYRLYRFSAEDQRDLKKYEKKHASNEWLYGETPEFDFQIDERYSFGGVQIYLKVKDGKISFVKTFTDANDESFPALLEGLLEERRFDKEELALLLKREGDARLDEIADSLPALLP